MQQQCGGIVLMNDVVRMSSVRSARSHRRNQAGERFVPEREQTDARQIAVYLGPFDYPTERRRIGLAQGLARILLYMQGQTHASREYQDAASRQATDPGFAHSGMISGNTLRPCIHHVAFVVSCCEPAGSPPRRNARLAELWPIYGLDYDAVPLDLDRAFARATRSHRRRAAWK